MPSISWTAKTLISLYNSAVSTRPLLFTYRTINLLMLNKLTLLLLNMTCPVLANSVDPDQLASSEAIQSGSVLFVIKYVNFYQKLGSSNLIGWHLNLFSKARVKMSCSLINLSHSNSLIQIVDINSDSNWQKVQIQISWLLLNTVDYINRQQKI